MKSVKEKEYHGASQDWIANLKSQTELVTATEMNQCEPNTSGYRPSVPSLALLVPGKETQLKKNNNDYCGLYKTKCRQ